jgi:RNA polymerase sigma factor (sigma-70 family)
VLAATVRVTRDIDAAEECVQDAYARALTAWSQDGVPRNPGAWLTTVARRRALDRRRHAATSRRKLPLLIEDDVGDAVDSSLADDAAIPDDRLRLIFTCCHPAIAPEAQVALTLRLLCGLTTAEVARSFLVSEPTMAARLTRAKKKIAIARIPYRVPPPAELPDRIDAVLTVVHLLYTTGHTAPAGATLVRDDLATRAIDLARMLRSLLPDEAGVAGLLGLLLLTDARRSTRVADDGSFVLLADQDRQSWDRPAINSGIALVRESLAARPPSRYALMAAIAAVHAEAPSFDATDWNEIVGLYDVLLTRWPSPVVALNRAVAVGLAAGPMIGLRELEPLLSEPQLAGYGYLASARASFLAKLDRVDEADAAYEEAILLTENAVEREFLESRRVALRLDRPR